MRGGSLFVLIILVMELKSVDIFQFSDGKKLKFCQN